MNVFGEFVPGAITEVEFPASVQPLALEDADLPAACLVGRAVKGFRSRAGRFARRLRGSRGGLMTVATAVT